MPEFIFMLTHHDRTLADALDVYDDIRDLPLRYVGLQGRRASRTTRSASWPGRMHDGRSRGDARGRLGASRGRAALGPGGV